MDDVVATEAQAETSLFWTLQCVERWLDAFEQHRAE
jgi:hypothetical protein